MTIDAPHLLLVSDALPKPINNGPTLEEIGQALARLPDDVVLARFRAAGFVPEHEQASPLDHDLMTAADNHEDWWKGGTS